MQPVEVVRRFFQAYNAHDRELMAASYSEWGSFAAPGGLTMQGRKDAAAFDRSWLAAFPDLAITLTTVRADGAGVVVEGVARGTHLGPLRLLDREVMPMGRSVEVPFCAVYSVDDGLIASAHLQYDRAGLLWQLEGRHERLEA